MALEIAMTKTVALLLVAGCAVSSLHCHFHFAADSEACPACRRAHERCLERAAEVHLACAESAMAVHDTCLRLRKKGAVFCLAERAGPRKSRGRLSAA